MITSRVKLVGRVRQSARAAVNSASSSGVGIWPKTSR